MPSSARATSSELNEIVELIKPLDEIDDVDPLIERIGDARLVLLGEASHGTSEFYAWRADITRRLISEHGFSFVAVEGDWPDCFQVNRYVKSADDDRTARSVLGAFDRWPTWMWANEEVAEFVEWLREHNRSTDADVGFYGLDVYSLWDSLREIMSYLAENEPDSLDLAREAIHCFDRYDEDPQKYAVATRMVPTSCEEEVISLLTDLRSSIGTDEDDPEAAFDAIQNAEVLAGAERYYRTMIRGGGESWNVRDHHMADTLDRLLEHHGPDAKVIVWEHNTHIGDARATDMASAGMTNVGQIVRERHGEDDAVLVGFGSHHGTVIAASAWGDRMRRMDVPRAPTDTHEDLIHRAMNVREDVSNAALLVFPDQRDTEWLSSRRGHRAIGVVYHPERDPYGNWVPTVMGRRYDAFIMFVEAAALHPLAFSSVDDSEEFETYPWST